MAHRSLQSILAVGLTVFFAGCKDKEPPAVVEEVPSSATAPETDTSATLAEEPSLSQIGKDAKPGSAKNTFHPSGSAEKAGFSESGRYVVQVAIFKSKRQAANLVEKLANSGYPAYVAEVESPVPDLSGTYHRVRIGRFQTISEARSFGDNTLKPNGYDFWVDNKKNDALGGSETSYTPAAESAPSSYESTPREPAIPSGETPPSQSWSAPASEPPAPSEPAATESWSSPATETPSATPSSAAPSQPAASPVDTGKVNLDEW